MNEYTISLIGIVGNVLIKAICFIIGYKIIKLGYRLLIDGIRGEFNFSAEYKGIKGGLVSSSPGLLFLLLGVLLIGYAMYAKKTVMLESEAKYPSNKERALKYNNNIPVKDSL